MIRIKLIDGKWHVTGTPNADNIANFVIAKNFVFRRNDKEQRVSYAQQIIELKREVQLIDPYRGPDWIGPRGNRRIGGGNTFANDAYAGEVFYPFDGDEFDPSYGMSESDFFGGDVGDKG